MQFCVYHPDTCPGGCDRQGTLPEGACSRFRILLASEAAYAAAPACPAARICSASASSDLAEPDSA